MATIPVSTNNPLEHFSFQINGTKPVNEAVAQVGVSSEQSKFSVLHSNDFFEILQTKGFPIERKVFVFEICRAPMASKMLAAYHGFAPVMPCRIALYEESSDMNQFIKEIMRSVLA